MKKDDSLNQIEFFRITRLGAEELGRTAKALCSDAALGAVLGAIETDLLKIAFIDDGRIYDDNLKPEALVEAYSKAKRDEERKREQVTQSRANYTAKQALRTEAIQGPKPKRKASEKKIRAEKAEAPPEPPKNSSTFTPAYEKAQGEARVRRKEKLESEAAKKASEAIQWLRDQGPMGAIFMVFENANGLSEGQAKGLLKRWVDAGVVVKEKSGEGGTYRAPEPSNGAAHSDA